MASSVGGLCISVVIPLKAWGGCWRCPGGCSEAKLRLQEAISGAERCWLTAGAQGRLPEGQLGVM